MQRVDSHRSSSTVFAKLTAPFEPRGLTPARSRSAPSLQLQGCRITNGKDRTFRMRLCDVVMRIDAPKQPP